MAVGRRSVGDVEATLHANTKRFITEAKAATDEVEGTEVEVKLVPDADDDRLREQLAKMRRIIEQNPAVLKVESNASEKDAEDAVAIIRGIVDNADAQLAVGTKPDLRQIDDGLDIARAYIENARAAELEVEMDLATGQASKVETEAELLLADGVDMPVEMELDDSSAAIAKLNAGARAAGRGGGRQYGQGFMQSLGDDSTWIGLGLSIATPLAEGLEGALGAATAVIGSGLSALGGAIGGAAPVLAAGAAAVGAVAIGIGDVNEAISAVNEGDWDTLETALKDMTPQAQAFVGAFAAIKGELDDIKERTQTALFGGLDQELMTMKDETLPDVGDAFVIAAGSVNEFLTKLIEVANETDFKSTMEAIDPALDNAFDSATLLAGTLPGLLEAAAPAAEELTGWLASGAGYLKLWVENNPDELETFFSDGVTDLQEWVGFLGSAAGLLATIFEAGSPSGTTMISQLDYIIRQWDQFLESTEGQQALDDFFTGARTTLQEMEPFLEGLVSAWDVLTDPANSGQWQTLMQQLGEAAPALAEALVAISELQIGAGLANVIDVLGVFAEMFQLLPDDLQAFAGQVIVVTKLMGPLSNALKAVGASTPWLAALNLAIGAGVFLWDKFVGSESEVTRNTEELGEALGYAFDQLIQGGEDIDKTALGMQALNDILKESDFADDLAEDLGTLGLTMDDANEAMIELSGVGGQRMLEFFEKTLRESDKFGEGLELNEEQAHALAQVLTGGESQWGDYGDTIEEVSKQTGISEQALEAAGDALKGLDETADSADFKDLIRGQLEAASTADDLTASALEAAAAATGIDWSHEGTSLAQLVELYNQFGLELTGAAEKQEQLNEAEANRGHAISDFINQAEQMIALSKERREALEAERAEAMAAYREEQRAAEELLGAVREVATADLGLDQDFVDGLIGLGEAFDQATERAQDFQSVMEVFRGGLPDLESAIAATETAFREAAEGIKETNEAGEEITVPPALEELRNAAGELITVWDLATASGVAYSEASRGIADAALEEAAAMLQSGAGAEEAIARMDELRESLINQLDAWGVPIDQAREYADTLLGTPTELETAISTPGLIEALLNAEDLTVLYDEAGKPVVAEFEALGLDLTTEEMIALRDLIGEFSGETFSATVGLDGVAGTEDDIETLSTGVTELGEQSADPSVGLSEQTTMLMALAAIKDQLISIDVFEANPKILITNYTRVVSDLNILDFKLDALDVFEANPKVQLAGYAQTKADIDTLQIELGSLDRMAPSVSISLPGIWDRISEVRTLDDEINGLRSRTITITTNRVTNSPGSMTGELILGPTNRNVGERGYREAIVPLDLPLSRVDPTVREMAALLRGEGGRGVSSSKDASGPRIEVNQVIQPVQADPIEVAVQVVNRIATLIET